MSKVAKSKAAKSKARRGHRKWLLLGAKFFAESKILRWELC